MLNLNFDENISYFIGVLHSDGCIYLFNDKKRNKIQIRLTLKIGERSIPMALKFQKVLFDYFNRTVNLRKLPNRNAYCIQTSINRDWDIFKDWNKGKIPEDIKINKISFGAYLAGLIDGDGHIKIKKNKDRIIPQCVIRIADNKPLIEVGILIEKYLKCNVHFVYQKENKCVETCFYVSKKNINFVRDYILPHIELTHKIHSLKKFLELKRACSDLNRGLTVSSENRSRLFYPG